MNAEFDSQPPAEDPVEGLPQPGTTPLDALKIGLRESIAWVIEQVQLGRLTPAQATEWLLRNQQPAVAMSDQLPSEAEVALAQPARGADESIAQLLDRLGAPPSDVIESWREQIRQLNGVARAAGREPLPSDLRRWLVAPSGQLYLSNIDVVAASSFPRPPASLVEQLFGRDHDLPLTDEIASSLTAPSQAPTDQPLRETFPPIDLISTLEADHGEPDERKEKQTESARIDRTTGRPSPLRRLLSQGLVVAGIAAIGAILFWALRPKLTKTITEKSPASNATVDGSASRDAASSRDGFTTAKKNGPSRPSTQGIDPQPTAALSSGQLETFQTAMGSDDLEIEIDPMSELLPLDRFFPTSPILSSEARGGDLDPLSRDPLSDAGGIVTDSVSDMGSESVMLSTGAGDDPLADESDQGQPDESPQPIRQASTTAILLPPASDFETLVSLSPQPLAEPSLQFPIDVAVDLRVATNSIDTADPQASAPAWAFVDRQRDEVLAHIFTTAEASTFQWTPAARSSTLSGLLGHGRLQDQSGQQIFLRPQTIADPYRLSFDQPDARPSWDLSLPLSPRVSRISVDFDFPKPTKSRGGLELGWIEPIDPTSPRGTRALAILTPIDGETIAVGIRFDIRCTRTLVARIRLFGRLDSRTPWQLISRPMLTQLTDQVTRQAMRLSQWSTHMSKVYAQANSDQRRLLRPQRDAIAQQQDRLVVISQRLVDLHGLINQIENEVQVRLRVWVEWPVAEGLAASSATYQQDLLRMDDGGE